MTANDPEKFPPALIRDGRIDVRAEFRNARRSEIAQLLVNLYGEEHEEKAKAFAARIPDGACPMAKIRSYLCSYPQLGDALNESNLVPFLASMRSTSEDSSA
jgi:hypothetical protein